MLRCQIRRPLVTTRSVESTPIETSTTDGGGFSGSSVAGSGNWSKIAMLARAIGASLKDVDVDARLLEGGQGLGHLIPLHREQGDLRIHHEAPLLDPGRQPLPVPDDLVEGEGNLLARLVLDDVGDLLGLDRRQLDELRQPRLARGRHGHAIARQVVAGRELGQGRPHELDRVGLRLGEHHRVFDEVETPRPRACAGSVGETPAAKRLEAASADIDSPDVRTGGHGPGDSRWVRGQTRDAGTGRRRPDPCPSPITS